MHTCFVCIIPYQQPNVFIHRQFIANTGFFLSCLNERKNERKRNRNASLPWLVIVYRHERRWQLLCLNSKHSPNNGRLVILRLNRLDDLIIAQHIDVLQFFIFSLYLSRPFAFSLSVKELAALIQLCDFSQINFYQLNFSKIHLYANQT